MVLESSRLLDPIMTNGAKSGWVRVWNVVVVLALLGLAWWGHSTHWHVPSIGELFSSEIKSANEKPKSASEGGYAPIEFESADVVRQVGIAVAPVLQQDLDLFIDANATVGYDQTKLAQVSPRVSGFVWKVNAVQGQRVRKGDVLALIDSPEVGQTRTDFLQEFSAHYFALKRAKRLEEGARLGAVSATSLRESEMSVLETRARRFSTLQKVLNLGLDVDLAQLDGETPETMAQRIHSLGLDPPTLEKLAGSAKTANLIPLFAPCDGVITQYDLVGGKRVSLERSDIEIADVRTMWIRLAVRKEDIAKVALAQSVQYRSASGGSPLTGKITWISTNVDEKTRTVQCRALFQNPCLNGGKAHAGPWVLRANEYGATQVKVGSIPQAVLVPGNAIQRLEDDVLVFVRRPDGKSFEARNVEIGERHGDLVQIRTGVQPGEQVATINSFVLKSELLKNKMESP
jgi:cobalt-zinc-cadmium efflux system membrane fusion protein